MRIAIRYGAAKCILQFHETALTSTTLDAARLQVDSRQAINRQRDGGRTVLHKLLTDHLHSINAACSDRNEGEYAHRTKVLQVEHHEAQEQTGQPQVVTAD